MMVQKNIKKSYALEAGADADEFKATIRKMFDDADINNDGVLVMDEFKQFTLNILEALSSHALGEAKEDLRSLF